MSIIHFDLRCYQANKIQSIFFDGKIDETLCRVKKGDKFHTAKKLEEHVTILEEPGSKYLGHIAPKDGTGSCIAEGILSYLEDKNTELRAIGCDGTNTNTGRKNGVISIL